MHSVNSDMQVFALLESQFMDVHKEPKPTWKSSDATNVHTSEYLHRGIQSFYTHRHEVSQRSLHTTLEIKKGQVSHVAIFTCLNNSFD